MPLFLVLFMAFILSSNAFAQESDVAVSEKECKKLIRINNFSSADYVGGIDAHGNKVKGADLGGTSPIKIPKEITFNIGIDLAEKYGLGAGGKYSSSSTLGQIKVKGRSVYWNGKKLGKGENNAILEACRKQYAPLP